MEQKVTFFLDLRHASAEYPLSRRKLYQLINEQRLSAFRLDGKIIIRRQDIEDLLTKQPITVTPVSSDQVSAQ